MCGLNCARRIAIENDYAFSMAQHITILIMGRFSKLETGAGVSSDKDPDAGPMGLHSRVRPKAVADDADGDLDYDQGHYFSEGERFFYAGDYKRSLRSYSRAMQVDHSAIEPWMGQILALIKLKQHREATMWAMRAMELFPDDPRLASLQGLTLALSGARQRAISCSDFAMGRPNGGNAFTWAIRGQILSHAENPNAAFCFDKVMETRDPDDWRILVLVGDFLVMEKKWARALEFLQPATQMNTRNGWLWKRLGYANERLGFTQPALEAYRAALEINPNDRDAQEHLRRIGSVPLPIRLWRRFARG